MTLWKVDKYYNKEDKIKYIATPYSMKGYIHCCWMWYGFKGLKNCYLFEKQARRKANKLNKENRT